MLIRIKLLEFSRFKSLGGDRFVDFFKIFEKFEFIVYTNVGKNHKNKKVTKIALYISIQSFRPLGWIINNFEIFAEGLRIL